MITVSGNMKLPALRIAAPAPPDTYLGIAEAMLEGVRTLAAASPPPSLALALLAAHALECLLKAYLSRKGDDSAVIKHNIRHDLETLWAMAHADGLGIPPTPPQWAERLAAIHNRPYVLRYSTGVHAIVLPGRELMTSELAHLLELVRGQLR